MDTLKKYVPINWDLALNPYNWVIIVLMLAIAALGGTLIFGNRSKKEA